MHIDRVEIKDVVLPDAMKRSMSRQAEAERERRSRVITAEGELQASRQLAKAAKVMTEHPAALQLRLLQTVVEVAAEKNSTLVLPFPVELLRFLERSTPPDTDGVTDANTEPRDASDAADPTCPARGPRCPRRPARRGSVDRPIDSGWCVQGAIGRPVTIRAATWPARRQSGGPAAGEVTWAGAAGGSLAW